MHAQLEDGEFELAFDCTAPEPLGLLLRFPRGAPVCGAGAANGTSELELLWLLLSLLSLPSFDSRLTRNFTAGFAPSCSGSATASIERNAASRCFHASSCGIRAGLQNGQNHLDLMKNEDSAFSALDCSELRRQLLLQLIH